MQSPHPVSCKFCGSPVIYNQEIRAFCNWGGEFDGLIHKDKRTGNTIEITSANVVRILEEVVILRSEIDRLRSANWDNGRKLDDLLQKVSKQND